MFDWIIKSWPFISSKEYIMFKFIQPSLFFLLFMNISAAFASDLTMNGTIESGTYTTAYNIITDGTCEIPAGAIVVFEATTVKLNPGFQALSGSAVTVSTKDADGLSNVCEMQYFGNLDHGPDEDADGDRITNLQECTLGLDPSISNIDSDGDLLPDWWEIENFGLNLGNGKNDDPDGDGVSNYIEYILGANPGVNDLPGPGIHYKYDAVGRIEKIYRIPAQ